MQSIDTVCLHKYLLGHAELKSGCLCDCPFSGNDIGCTKFDSVINDL